MKLNYILILILALASSPVNHASAQSARFKGVSMAFRNMPDDMIPYINKDMREMLLHMQFEADCDTAKVEVENRVGSKSVLLQLTENLDMIADTTLASCDGYLHLKASDNYDVQIIQEYPFSSITLIETYGAPETESVISQYDACWRKIGNLTTGMTVEQFISDSATDDMRKKIMSYLDWKMFTAKYNPQEKNLTISLSMPNLSDEEKKEIKPFVLQRNVKLDNLVTK